VVPTVSASPAVDRHLHLVFLIRSFGFPEGMAATNRVRLLGRALIEQGADVRALCMRVSERPGEIRNTAIRGVSPEGISFLYTTGSTVRAPSFIARRLIEARGCVGACRELARLQRRGQLDCAYLAAAPNGWRPSVWLLTRWLRALGVPLVIEFNELPGEMSWLPRPISRRLSHLSGMTGAVTISRWLTDWTTAEATRIGRRVAVIDVPIVVDIAEQAPSRNAGEPPTFVYSASPGYGRTVTHIVRALKIVWQKHPRCRLAITGMKPEAVADLIGREGLQDELDTGLIVNLGYVDRRRLLELYGEAAALLVPLFDDPRSRARFPTKIGEYLASARPVVTTSVGEVERYLHDGQTAFVAQTGDVQAFAAKLVAVLDDPAAAAAIGAAGRRLAEERFQYSLQGPRLRTFLASIAQRGPVDGHAVATGVGETDFGAETHAGVQST
jgi:glycosyltransferase involved in cell wall biosynthesis